MRPWRWLRADELGLGLSRVRHYRGHVEQLGDAVIGAGVGDHHPAVGVPAQDDRPLGGADRLAARVAGFPPPKPLTLAGEKRLRIISIVLVALGLTNTIRMLATGKRPRAKRAGLLKR